MRSKANIKGHPIHPMLIPFPIAFLIGTLVFDLLSLTSGNPNYWQTGGYLEIAGIITALMAAVPGVIDYFNTVPPQSSGKKRATAHGLINLSLVIVFAIAYMLRHDSSTIVVIALEAIGSVMLFISGWMGGTLAYRNQIGVDIRYAGAGKWNESHVADNRGLIEVAAAGELKTDQMKLVHIGTKRVVLGKTETGYVAFEDRCCHKGGSLAGGAMLCGTVQCPWHGSQFDCSTGEVKAGPAKENIMTYPVKETDGKVYINY
jgi:uncharacterized membrane protein/nitrite reductase/ring-hydroxylating ferredoxin subunit